MMVSLHHGSPGKVHKFAGSPHFCRFSKVCKCIRHTIILLPRISPLDLICPLLAHVLELN